MEFSLKLLAFGNHKVKFIFFNTDCFLFYFLEVSSAACQKWDAGLDGPFALLQDCTLVLLIC